MVVVFTTQGRRRLGAGGHAPPTIFEIIGFKETFMFRRKIFGLLLLVKIKALNFIRKSLNFSIRGSMSAIYF